METYIEIMEIGTKRKGTEKSESNDIESVLLGTGGQLGRGGEDVLRLGDVGLGTLSLTCSPAIIARTN